MLCSFKNIQLVTCRPDMNRLGTYTYIITKLGTAFRRPVPSWILTERVHEPNDEEGCYLSVILVRLSRY